MKREHKKFERLFLFSEVAKQLSFTKAAEVLGISRGYLSEQIRQLELEFGRALLIRSTRTVKLTAQGELIFNCMGEVKESLLDLDRKIRHDNSTIAGRIRITAPSQFTQRYLLTICNEFKALHPDIEFSIDCSYTLYDLTQNDFDLAFRSTQSPPLNMVAKKMFNYNQACCASSKYLAEFGSPTSVEQLLHHQCITANEKSTWTFDEQSTVIPNSLCISDNNMLKELAINDKGIILVAEYLVDKEIKGGVLKKILTNYMTSESSIYLIHPQLIHQSARLSHFIQFTTNWFNENL